MTSINQNLRHLREREGLSPRTMARRLRVPRDEYELLESNAHELTVNELIDCCEAMNVPVAELFEGGRELPGHEVPPRANVIRAYKSAMTLAGLVKEPRAKIIIDRLRADLLKIIPTMGGEGLGVQTYGVGPWPVRGQLRGSNEPSARELCPIDTKCFSTDATYEHA